MIVLLAKKTVRGGTLASCDTHSLITILASYSKYNTHSNNLVSLLILLLHIPGLFFFLILWL